VLSPTKSVAAGDTNVSRRSQRLSRCCIRHDCPPAEVEGTDAIDGAALAAATNKYLEEEIVRLEEAAPRFTYQMSYALNMGFDVATFTPLGPKHIASIVRGNKRIDVFVRDSEAARLDPP